jgi:hypothetical protein
MLLEVTLGDSASAGSARHPVLLMKIALKNTDGESLTKMARL